MWKYLCSHCSAPVHPFGLIFGAVCTEFPGEADSGVRLPWKNDFVAVLALFREKSKKFFGHCSPRLHPFASMFSAFCRGAWNEAFIFCVFLEIFAWGAGVFQESVGHGLCSRWHVDGCRMVFCWKWVLDFFVDEFFDVFGLELSQTPKIARIACVAPRDTICRTKISAGKEFEEFQELQENNSSKKRKKRKGN